MLQVLLRITEAVMKRPQDNQRKDSFAESLASLLFRVWLHLVCYTLSDKQAAIEMDLSSPLFFGSEYIVICLYFYAALYSCYQACSIFGMFGSQCMCNLVLIHHLFSPPASRPSLWRGYEPTCAYLSPGSFGMSCWQCCPLLPAGRSWWQNGPASWTRLRLCWHAPFMAWTWPTCLWTNSVNRRRRSREDAVRGQNGKRWGD